MSSTQLVLAAGLVVLAAITAIVCGALVEVFRQLADIRATLVIDDSALELQVKSELAIADLPMPEEARRSSAATVILLSGKCATCRAIADGFRDGAPESVWFVVSIERGDGDIFASLDASLERVVLDPEGLVAQAMGTDVTPTLARFREGVLVDAHAVSSVRQVLALLDEQLGHRPTPEETSLVEQRP